MTNKIDFLQKFKEAAEKKAAEQSAQQTEKPMCSLKELLDRHIKREHDEKK